MFATDDSIVAIATPPGRGGIGVVRISGPSAPGIASAILERRAPLEPRRATYTRLRTPAVADEVVVTYFAAPHSYTGEHVVEISAHGSPIVLRAIVRGAIDAGARLAQPGEFTLRAFLNGRRDLVQAEAVADLIDAATPLQVRVAFDQLDGTLTRRIAEIDAELYDLVARLEASLDFPEEGYHFIEPEETSRRISAVIARLNDLLGDARRGRMIREGVTAAIAGRPNVGKSSLFNMLAGHERAIVTDIAGTTRDLVTERVDIEGLAITLVDTAGWRETLDAIEREGVARASHAREAADLILLVLDQSEPLTADDERLLDQSAGRARIVVGNKCDRPAAFELSRLKPVPTFTTVPASTTVPTPTTVGAGFRRPVLVSSKTGDGIEELRHAIVRELTGSESLRDTAAISNTRHTALLEDALINLASAQQAAAARPAPEEFVLTDLQAARARFDEVVGTRTSEDLLQHIFERFCIGK